MDELPVQYDDDVPLAPVPDEPVEPVQDQLDNVENFRFIYFTRNPRIMFSMQILLRRTSFTSNKQKHA